MAMTPSRTSTEVIKPTNERNFTVSPTIPVVLIKSDTQISGAVVTNTDGSVMGRIAIGPPDHTHPFGADAALITNSPETLEGLAEIAGQLAADLRRAAS